jgi:hypothetical protein
MSDPVLSLVLIFAFFVFVTAASYFKTLDGALWRDGRVPLIAGLLCGPVILAVKSLPHAVATGVILTLAALYVRLTGRESEAAEGMAHGAMMGTAASLTLVVFAGEREMLRFAECILAGAVAGFGITFALTHVRQKTRQAAIDAATAVAAVFAAWLPSFLLRSNPRIQERDIAIGAAALVPLLLIITVFKQWPSIRTELDGEATLGFIFDEDVRATAHPLRRLGRAGWHDASAHREFVRIANKIALRKRQQRSRPEEIARLYQLEVIKLRMELQEMTRIDRAMRVHAEQEQQVAR